MANDSSMMDWIPNGIAPNLSAPMPKQHHYDLPMPGGFPLTPSNPSTPILERIRQAEDSVIYNTSKRLCTSATRAALAVNAASSSIVSIISRFRHTQRMSLSFRFPTRSQRHISASEERPGHEIRTQYSATRQPNPLAAMPAQEAQPSPVAMPILEAPASLETTPKPAIKLWSPFPILRPTSRPSYKPYRPSPAPAPAPVLDSPGRQFANDLDTSASESDSTSNSFDDKWKLLRTPSRQTKPATPDNNLSSAVPNTSEWYHNGDRWVKHTDLAGSPTKRDTDEGKDALGLESLQISSRKTRRTLLNARHALGDNSRFDIKPLSKEWQAKVEAALKNGHGPLQARDFEKIVPPDGSTGMRAWLNDESINEYLKLVTAHANKGIKPKSTPRMHAFSTFFYTSLKTGGYQKVQRWAKKANIAGAALLDVEKIFIPINPNQSHWTLAVIEPKIKHITHYNSLGNGSRAYLEDICEWLNGELGAGFDKDDWILDFKAGSPQQANTSDCGVFTVTTAKQIMLGISPLTYSAKDIPTQRKRMVAELVNGALLQNGN